MTTAPHPEGTVESVAHWFQLAVPAPTDKNRAVQLGCHYEEIHEMTQPLSPDTPLSIELKVMADYLKGHCPGLPMDHSAVNRVEMLDALCDQIVTAIGVAHMFGLDIIEGMRRVDRSNYSKFVDGSPLFDANGKVKKGPHYEKADLRDLV